MYIQYSPNCFEALRMINILYIHAIAWWYKTYNSQQWALIEKYRVKTDHDAACYLLFTHMFYVYFTSDSS